MPPTVSETAVRAAIASQRVPQCYEQLARKIERALQLPEGSVTGQLLSGKVRALINQGDVVEIRDHEMLRRLHAHPQHFSPGTRFFMAYEHVPSALLQYLPPRPQPRAEASPTTATSRPPTCQVGAVDRPRPPSPAPAEPETPPTSTTQGKSPSATVRALDFSVSRPDCQPHRAPVPAVAFSAGTGAAMMPPVDAPAQDQLDRAKALLAASLRAAARAIRRQADDSLLPLNKAWLDGSTQLSTAAAAELGRMYALACDRAVELDAEADGLVACAADVERSTGTGG